MLKLYKVTYYSLSLTGGGGGGKVNDNLLFNKPY